MTHNEIFDNLTQSPRNIDVDYNGAPEEHEDPADYTAGGPVYVEVLA